MFIVANDNTKNMIQTAIQGVLKTVLPVWPGLDFTVNSDGTGTYADQFYGLLGTYHAAGPGYLLAQHRALFGQVRIRTIRVWNQGGPWTVGTDFEQLAPCMMMFVEAVPA